MVVKDDGICGGLSVRWKRDPRPVSEIQGRSNISCKEKDNKIK
jgi:hypothetical protein